MLSYPEALKIVLAAAPILDTEYINLEDSLGRILAEDVKSDRNYPPFNRAAMDGFAFRKTDYEAGNRIFFIKGSRLAGEENTVEILSNEALKIMTGAKVPADLDAIIKIEDCQIDGNSVNFSEQNLKDFQHIAKMGEDILPNMPVLLIGMEINHAELGLLATLGKPQVCVYKMPKVALISTGTELKKPSDEVTDFQIRESNSYVLRGQLNYLNIKPEQVYLVEDDPEKMKSVLESALQADIVILTGGVSMGDADYVPKILQDAGVEKLFHKTAIKPGKPIWFGKKGNAVVFALPGNPLSAQITFKLFVDPYIRRSVNRMSQRWHKLIFDSQKNNNTGLDLFFPIVVRNGKVRAMNFNGSGDIKATLFSDGIGWLRADQEKLSQGENIDIMLWQDFLKS